MQKSTHRFVEFNCCHLSFSVRDSECSSRWVNLAERERSYLFQWLSRGKLVALVIVKITLLLKLSTSSTDLINTSNKADRSVYVLWQHGAVYSWFRDIQYTCHLDGLLFSVTELGTLQYRAGNAVSYILFNTESQTGGVPTFPWKTAGIDITANPRIQIERV